MKDITGINKKPSKDGGFSMIDVMIAIAFFSMTSMALLSMQLSAIKGNSFAHSMTDASACITHISEVVSGMSYDAVNQSRIQQIASGFPATFLFDSVVEEKDLDYDGDGDLKKISLSIHWKDKKQRNISFNLMIPKEN